MKFFKMFEDDIFKSIGIYAMTFFAIIIFFWFLLTYCFFHYTLSDDGMEPFLKANQEAHSFVFHPSNIERGDIVIVRNSDDSGYVVRRVIALPMDTVTCIDEIIYVNGEPIQEDYLDKEFVEKTRRRKGYFTKNFDLVELWEKEYFLLGDNRPATQEKDSRALGSYVENRILADSLILNGNLFEIIK